VGSSPASSDNNGEPREMTQLLVMQAAIVSFFKKFGEDERGASLVEYALLLALIAVVAITALIFLGGAAKNQLNNVGQQIVSTKP
jgi:Flp pilus assembly pilin Flp